MVSADHEGLTKGSRFHHVHLDKVWGLRAKIRNGFWPIGMLLPGRKQRAKEQSVALNTVQRAVTNLLADGTLRVEANRGTFVAKPVDAPDQPLRDSIASLLADGVDVMTVVSVHDAGASTSPWRRSRGRTGAGRLPFRPLPTVEAGSAGRSRGS